MDKGNETYIPKKIIELKNQYNNQVFFYKIQDFDHLMEVMFKECECEPPEVLLHPEKNNIIKEFQKSVTSGKSTVDLTSYQNRLLAKFLEANKRQKYTDDDTEMIVETKFGLGKNYRSEGFRLLKRGLESEAKENFLKAIDEYKGCETIVNDFLEKNQQLPTRISERKIYIYCLKRLTGVYIALGKVSKALKKNKKEY